MLRAAVYVPKLSLEEIHKLPEYNINVINSMTAIRELRKRNGSVEVQIVILELMEKDNERQAEILDYCRQRGVAVVGVADESLTDLSQYVDGDLHDLVSGIIPANAQASEIACAVWSAHGQSSTRQRLREELESLRQKSERNDTINRAVTITAQRAELSEADVLRRLRREAGHR